RGIDLEVRVLGRRPDQRYEPFLDRGKQCILLRLVEAVDLIEEENRPLAVRAEALACAREHLPDLRHRRRHSGQLLEGRTGGVSDDARDGRLAAAGRTVENGGRHTVLLDREAEG